MYACIRSIFLKQHRGDYSFKATGRRGIRMNFQEVLVECIEVMAASPHGMKCRLIHI